MTEFLQSLVFAYPWAFFLLPLPLIVRSLLPPFRDFRGAVRVPLFDVLVESTVRSLLKGGAATLGLCKSLLEGVESLGFARSGELSARMIAEARTNPEAQAALDAFQAKEKSPWVEDTGWFLPPREGGEG